MQINCQNTNFLCIVNSSKYLRQQNCFEIFYAILKIVSASTKQNQYNQAGNIMMWLRNFWIVLGIMCFMTSFKTCNAYHSKNHGRNTLHERDHKCYRLCKTLFYDCLKNHLNESAINGSYKNNFISIKIRRCAKMKKSCKKICNMLFRNEI